MVRCHGYFWSVEPIEEDVLIVDVLWDGPRSGIASFRGTPHSFDCIFDDALDDWTDQFLLRPLDDETVVRVLAGWQELRTHPPNDERQYRERVQSLRGEVQPDPPTALRARGRFCRVSGEGLDAEYTARWTPLDDAATA